MEYEVLTYLHQNEQITQRKIAHRTGLSLGAVNLLLNKMARKGLLKIEKLNARTVRYILTPQGMREKARLAYRYVRRSYRQILKINQAVDELLQGRFDKGAPREVVLFGPADEIREIIIQHLAHRNIPLRIYEDTASPKEIVTAPDLRCPVLTWRYEDEEKLAGCGRAVNIMKLI